MQSCVHEAVRTELYGKFKSVSEVIGTMCAFPAPGLWEGDESQDRQGFALEVCSAEVRSQTCSPDQKELLKGLEREALVRPEQR